MMIESLESPLAQVVINEIMYLTMLYKVLKIRTNSIAPQMFKFLLIENYVTERFSLVQE